MSVRRRENRTSRRRCSGEGGAALVEFAILAPLIFALLLGMFTGGISMSRKNSMTNAVREGARLGATLPEGTGTAFTDAVQGRVVDLAAGDLTTSQVCVRLVKAPSTVKKSSSCPAAMASLAPSLTGIPADSCVVMVWAHRTSKMEVVFYSRDLNLDAKAVSRYERECT